MRETGDCQALINKRMGFLVVDGGQVCNGQ